MIAGLLATLILTYILWPVQKEPDVLPPVFMEAAFLETDPAWADSVLNTLIPEEQLAQLFFPVLPLSNLKDDDSIVFEKGMPEPGGIVFSGHFPERQLRISASVLRQQKVPLLLSHESPFYAASPNKIITDQGAIFGVGDTSFTNRFIRQSIELFPAVGCDLLFFPQSSSVHFSLSEQLLQSYLHRTGEKNLLGVAGKLDRIFDPVKDSLINADSLLRPWRTLCDSGLAVIEADTALLRSRHLKKGSIAIRDFCEDHLDFKGLLLARFPEGEQDPALLLRTWFAEGMEIIVTGTDHFKVFDAARNMLKRGEISEQELQRRTRKILLAKSWIRKQNFRTSEDLISPRKMQHAFGKVFAQQLEERSVVLLNERSEEFPLRFHQEKRMMVLAMGEENMPFRKEIQRYADVNWIPIHHFNELSAQKPDNLKRFSPIVLFLNNIAPTAEEFANCKSVFSRPDLIVVHSGQTTDLPLLQSCAVVVHSDRVDAPAQEALARALLGTEAISGRLTRHTGSYKAGHGKKQNATRLKFARPEEIGVANDSLYRIDAIMDEAIRNHALPGGQVLLAYDSKIIFHKSFGHHTYDRKIVVDQQHRYDMASVTKVAATTMMAMHLYEQGKFLLDDSLKKHLPDTLDKFLPSGSSLKHVTFRQLLVHASGLPPGQNIFRFMRFDEERSPYDLYFCDERSKQFSLVVGDSFYLDKDCLDTLWLDLNKIWLDPAKPYSYSDANMNLLYTMLAAKLKKGVRWERAVDSLFYQPLGMKRTGYIPLQKGIKKEEIAPTENDRYWRRQLIQGHVHDPTAALYGGVAGNAGLFSNAYDMAVLFQMLLNKGEYGGRRYLKRETVELFTSRQNGSHRGLGFNMQVSGSTYGCSPYASASTYGHTGFTGTAVWVDPERKFIYVFISNRVHPDPENKKIIKLGITKRIHNVLYEQLGFGVSEPVLL